MANLMQTHAGNGGFPEPPGDEMQRLVRVRHADCGAETRVRLPRAIPAGVVRRVVCERCAATYECDQVEEIGVLDPAEAIARAVPSADPVAPVPSTDPVVPAVPSAASQSPPRRRLPRRPSLPAWVRIPHPTLPYLPIESRAWRYGSVVVAAAIVIGVLLLIQGGSNDTPTTSAVRHPGAPAPSSTVGSQTGTAVPTGASRLVTEPGYFLALPAGWQRVPPQGGAAFAARANGGGAEATLWIQRAPQLSFQEFETRSLDQLRSLAGDAAVVDRTPAPTMAGTVVRLRADTPAGSYDVTLRAAGPYRYYLSTTVDPGAGRPAVDGADLIHQSFVPQASQSQTPTTGAPPGSTAPDSGSATP
jgi:hypothetical protein